MGMKKFLGIVVLGLLWSNMCYANVIMQDLRNKFVEKTKDMSKNGY